VVRLAVEIYGPVVELSYSRRPKTHSQLLPPAVVGRAGFRGLLTHLTYSRRGRPINFRQPERVGQVGSLGPETHLTRIKPRKTTYRLRPPAVVGRGIAFHGPGVYLTRPSRGRTLSFLAPPVAQAADIIFLTEEVVLTRIRVPQAYSTLKPPTVVGAGIAFYGPQITLTRIKPPRVTYFLRLTLVAFRRPHGDVCGFDIALTFVCSLEVPGSQVSGGSSTRFGVTGSSRAASNITGSESAGGGVSGSDRKAT
jgi:hypothetical protein